MRRITLTPRTRDAAHFLLNFIPAPRKMHLSRGRFSAQNAHCPLLFQKRTVEEFAGSSTTIERSRRRGHAAPPQACARASAARRSASSRRPGFADSALPFLAPAADRGTRRRVRRRGSDSGLQSRLPRNRRRYMFVQSRRSGTRTCRGTLACRRSSACIQGRTRPGLRWDSPWPLHPVPKRHRAPSLAPRKARLGGSTTYCLLDPKVQSARGSMLARSFTTRLASHPRAISVQEYNSSDDLQARWATAQPSLRLHRARTFGCRRVA